MKINEKNLCMFAVTPPVDLEGYLTKRGEVNKSWQKRYFVLKGNLLFYFEKRGEREPLGVIIIEGCTIGKRLSIINKSKINKPSDSIQNYPKTVNCTAFKLSSMASTIAHIFCVLNLKIKWSNG